MSNRLAPFLVRATVSGVLEARNGEDARRAMVGIVRTAIKPWPLLQVLNPKSGKHDQLAHQLPKFTYDHLASLAIVLDTARDALKYFCHDDAETAQNNADMCKAVAEWTPFAGDAESWQELGTKFESQAQQLRGTL